MRVEAEQRRGFAHRVERAGSLAAEPVIAGHRERVQRAEAFFAFAHRRCRGGVGAGPRGGGAPGPGGLEQVGLGQPPGIVGGRPPGPGLGAGGTFLLVQHALRLFVVCGLPGGPGCFEADGDLSGCGEQGGQLRYPLGGVAEGLAERFG